MSESLEEEILPFEECGEEEEEDIEAMMFRLQLGYEKATLEQLLKLEDLFREVYEILKKTLHEQLEVVDRLCALSQRYTLLNRNPRCNLAQEFLLPAEDVILHDFNENLTTLRESNATILQSLAELREECRIFEGLYSQLNTSFQTDFMLGDSFHQPISFFKELVFDLFSYMHAWILKLKLYLSLIEPLDCTTISEYGKLLEPSLDFEEYLKKGLTYCKCLQPKAVCVIKRTISHTANFKCKR